MTKNFTSSMLSNFFRSGDHSAEAVEAAHSHLLNHASDPDVQQAISDLWQSTEDATTDQYTIDMAFAKVQQEITPAIVPLKVRIKKALRMAAVWMLPLVAAALIAMLAFDNISLRNELNTPITYANYYAPMGTSRQITLPDSSHVWLHGGSTLVIASNFNDNERRVYLTGEGFFKVAHNPEKKFVVSTNNLEMTVLGTEFNISSYPEDSHIVTTLEKGKLQVLNTTNRQSLILKPGDQVAFDNANCQFTLRQVVANDFSAWRYGYIFINNMKVCDLMHRLERDFNVQFVGPENATYLNQRVRARFNQDEDLTKILDIMHMLVPEFSYRVKGDTVYFN